MWSQMSAPLFIKLSLHTASQCYDFSGFGRTETFRKGNISFLDQSDAEFWLKLVSPNCRNKHKSQVRGIFQRGTFWPKTTPNTASLCCYFDFFDPRRLKTMYCYTYMCRIERAILIYFRLSLANFVVFNFSFWICFEENSHKRSKIVEQNSNKIS